MTPQQTKTIFLEHISVFDINTIIFGVEPHMSSVNFEMLVLDPGRKTRYENALSLLYAIRSFSGLWHTPELNQKTLKIEDGTTFLQVANQAAKVSKEAPPKAATRAFSISLTGEFDAIEPLRVLIVDYIKAQEFEHRYITKDEVSEHIACELYPYLYRVENRLRGYLTHVMTTRFGGGWWKVSASKEMDDKVKMRKKNERVFGSSIDNSAFLIDFDELGELIFEQTSGFLTREDIEYRVRHLPEDIEALKKLKSDLQSNYHKFFKTAFADRDFKSKWKDWELLRNKIAHTNLFTKEDLTNGKRIADELILIIGEAYESPEQPVITQVEREAVQEQIIARTIDEDPLPPDSLKDTPILQTSSLTEAEFLDELRDQEEFYSNRPNGFVGLVRFLRFHLTELGHSESAAKEVLKQLQGENKVEVYRVDNPYNSAQTLAQTAALRRIK
ncbi:MAG: hypothetical protein KME11_15460 [Timaviella obliquedivisa GSE-PSE-MK23-08B]|jgi:hypothetical protein|nr:hypothetical protein [Timaviella obliquedivisa GSE-PSE-MK23-08B]